MAKAAVLGYGTVGSGVVEVLDTNSAEVEASAGEKVEVKYILDLRDFPGDKHESQIVHEICYGTPEEKGRQVPGRSENAFWR